MLLRRIVVWAVVFATTAVVAEEDHDTTTVVTEEDRQLDSYQYLDDLSGKYASYKTCFRLKYSDNDDDNEGNTYFFNGKYYARYLHYAAFQLCNECGSDCDESTGYVTDLETYLETLTEFVQNYCAACTNQCRRRLEDEQEDEDDDNDVTVDCNICADQCSLYGSASSGYDEANYLECQAGYNDGETQYYQSPTCNTNDGTIVMGLFYDDECSVKSQESPEFSFDYHTFGTIQSMCVDCSENDDTCLYADSTHCYGTQVMQGDDVCKKYSEAVSTITYAARKKKFHILPKILTFLIVVGFAGFLSHAYFIRHRDKKNIPLATLDHSADGRTSTDPSAGLPPLPPPVL